MLYARWNLYEHNALFFDLHRLQRAGETEQVRHILRQVKRQRLYLNRTFEEDQ